MSAVNILTAKITSNRALQVHIRIAATYILMLVVLYGIETKRGHLILSMASSMFGRSGLKEESTAGPKPLRADSIGSVIEK